MEPRDATLLASPLSRSLIVKRPACSGLVGWVEPPGARKLFWSFTSLQRLRPWRADAGISRAMATELLLLLLLLLLHAGSRALQQRDGMDGGAAIGPTENGHGEQTSK